MFVNRYVTVRLKHENTREAVLKTKRYLLKSIILSTLTLMNDITERNSFIKLSQLSKAAFKEGL